MTRTGEPGTDYPEERVIVDVLVAGREETLLSWVERVEDRDLVVTVGQDRARQRLRLDDGERVQLVWRGVSELRSLPAQFVGTEGGPQKYWRLRPTGPAVSGQRRSAVRAPLSLGLAVSAEDVRLTGVTVDISEGGFRGLLRPVAGAGTSAPQVGDVFDVVVDLDPGRVEATAEVIRRHERKDDLHEVSARFVGLSERAEDLIRARVFAGLRDLRQRGLL